MEEKKDYMSYDEHLIRNKEKIVMEQSNYPDTLLLMLQGKTGLLAGSPTRT